MRRFIFLLLIIALFVFAWLRWERGAGWLGKRTSFTPAAGPVLDVKDLPVMNALDGEYTKLVQTVVPSVVSIATQRRVRVPLVDPLDFFFGRQRITERTENALGSGVVVSKEGHILTNHHVVANMEQIQVQFTDGRVLPAKVIGSDELVDIAVLQVDATNLTPLPLGDSDQVRVGQMVFAVGNPFGLQETVTRGIISAKGRALHDSGVEFLQTDAAINPGNSGGPLLNLRGEIIGINSSIYSQTGGWAGISFAIPANTARATMDSLIRTGKPIRGYIGLNMMQLSPVMAQQLGLQDTRGAVVSSVVPGSPADRAGLQRWDVVRSFNGRPIEDAVSLYKQIASASIGSKVQVDFIRKGAAQSAVMEVTEVPPAPTVTAQAPASPGGQPPAGTNLNNVLAGVDVAEIPAKLRDSLPENAQGVVITQIQPGSVAAEQLRVGDVIEEVGGQPVRSVNDFYTLAKAIQPGNRAMVYVARGQMRAFVVLVPH